MENKSIVMPTGESNLQLIYVAIDAQKCSNIRDGTLLMTNNLVFLLKL